MKNPPRRLFDWGREVTGYVSLDVPASTQMQAGLLYTGSKAPPDPRGATRGDGGARSARTPSSRPFFQCLPAPPSIDGLRAPASPPRLTSAPPACLLFFQSRGAPPAHFFSCPGREPHSPPPMPPPRQPPFHATPLDVLSQGAGWGAGLMILPRSECPCFGVDKHVAIG